MMSSHFLERVAAVLPRKARSAIKFRNMDTSKELNSVEIFSTVQLFGTSDTFVTQEEL